MRIRTVKPEFWQSEELAETSETSRLVAIGLLNCSDDEGFFNANEKLIESMLFPLTEPSVSIHECFNELSNAGYLKLYKCKDGKRVYGHVVNFSKHQKVNRPTPSKIKDLIDFTEDSVSSHEQLTSGKERKGKEQGTGNREQGETEQGALPTAKARIASIDYQEVANRYNEFADRHKDVPGVSNADRWTAARKNKVRDLFILNKDKWLVDGSWEYGFFDRYLNAVERYGGWMLERRNKGNGEQWQAKNIDYLVSRKCEQAIRDAIRDVEHAD